MATTRKPARATNETLSQLQPAFVFNLNLGSRPTLTSPVASLVSRVMAHTRLGAVSDNLPRRLAGVQTLGVGVSRRYQTFSANLGPLNRAVRYRRQPARPGDMPLWDTDSYSDFDSAEPAPIAREYATPQLQTPRQPAASEMFAPSQPEALYPTQLWEDNPVTSASPLSTQVASFQPTIMRNLAATAPTTGRLTGPTATRPADYTAASFSPFTPDGATSYATASFAASAPEVNSNLAPAPLTALQRNFARLDAAEATETVMNGTTASADLTRPAALSLNYYGPGLASRQAVGVEPAATDYMGYGSLNQPSLFGTSPSEIARAYQENNFATPAPVALSATSISPAPGSVAASTNEVKTSITTEPRHTVQIDNIVEPNNGSAIGLSSGQPASIAVNTAHSPIARPDFVENGNSLNQVVQRASAMTTLSESARPAVGDWSRSLAVLQTNPALTINRWLADTVASNDDPGFSAEPRLGLNWYAPGRRPTPAPREAASDPVARLMADFSPADFSPAVQRTQATLVETPQGQSQVVLPAVSSNSTAAMPTLPGTGLIDRAMVSSASTSTSSVPIEAVQSRSVEAFNTSLGQSVSPLMRAMERADSLEVAYRPDEADFGLPLTYAQSAQRRQAPAISDEGTAGLAGSFEGAAVSETIARLYQPALAAQEVSARFEQTSRGPNNLTSLQAMPGFEATANVNPFVAAPVAPGWSGTLAALQSNPGVVARSLAAPADNTNTGWNAPGELTYAQPGQRRRPEVSPVENDESGAEPTFTSIERTVLRTLTNLGSEQEVGQRLTALVSQMNGEGASAASPFTADRSTSQFGGERSEGVQRFFDPAIAPGSVARLGEQNQAGGPLSSDFGATDLNYVTPPLTLRKAAAPALAGEGAELAENLALSNFLSSLGISANPTTLGAAREPQSRPTNDSWDGLAMTYAEVTRPPEPRPRLLDNPFAFNPGVLSGLNLATQTRRVEPSGAADAARLPLIQRQPAIITSRAEIGSADLFGEAGDVSDLATHFETPFDQPIGVVGHPQLPMLQRKASGQVATGSARSFERVLNTSVGQSLDRTVQRRLEPVFNTSFEHVRVHTGSAASDYTSQMGAEAFTVGPNIFFAPGRYQPQTPEGQSLIGHELTHVVQQANLPSLGGGRIPETSAQGQALEHEALGNERLLLRHLSSSQPDTSSMRVSGETHLNLNDVTSSFSPSNSNAVQRSYRPVEPVHLQESAPTANAEPALGSVVERVIDAPAQQPASHSGGDHTDSKDNGPKVEEIAEQVYRMLRQRLIIERERGGPSGGRFF